MRKKLLAQLFVETLKISALTFGGGYVIVPLMKKRFVDQLELITEDEMLNMIAVAQSAPGALAINTSIILGYKLYGIIGAITATIATVLPPLVIITIISNFYQAFKANIYVNNALIGMSAGISAVILFAVIGMIKPMLNSKPRVIAMIFALILTLWLNTIYIILGTVIASVIYTYFIAKKEIS